MSGERTRVDVEKRQATPALDRIAAIRADAIKTDDAKRQDIAKEQGRSCLAALRSLGLPRTVELETPAGVLAVTILSAGYHAGDEAMIEFRGSATLDGKPVADDLHHVIPRPRLIHIVPGGENVFVHKDEEGNEVKREAWREDPATIALRDVVEGALVSLRNKGVL